MSARIQRPAPLITVDLTELRVDLSLDLPGRAPEHEIHPGDWVTRVVREDRADAYTDPVARLAGQVESIRRDTPYELGNQPHTVRITKLGRIPPETVAVERPT